MQTAKFLQLQAPAVQPCWRPAARDIKQPLAPALASARFACPRPQLISRRERLVTRYRHGQKPAGAEQAADAATQAQSEPTADAASLNAAAAAPAYSPEFVKRRWMVFAGIVLGYTTFYLTRGSLTYSAPLLVADPTLGLDLKAVGTMTSIFPMAYGVSKFVSGVVGTTTSARLMLGLGLAATAVVNLAFGASSSLTLFCVLWGLNGALQGVGAPACASILTRWYASKERGTYWGMWNISHNLGGFLAPIVAGGTAKAFGWRWGMWSAGIIGTLVALGVLTTVKDKPQDAGLTPPDDGKKKAPAPAPAAAATQELAGAAAAAPAATEAPKAAAAATTSSEPSMMTALKSVLRLPGIWALAFTYFFIYVVRQGVTSWLVFYLMAEKGALDAGSAALTVTGLELGGLAGSTVAGALSDRFIQGAKGGSGHVGKRVQVVMLYTLGTAACLLALQAVPASASALQWITIAALGFCIYGPQMLIGLSGAELVAPGAVGASQGILGWIAYLGAANAGIPLAYVVEAQGWNGFFGALLGACAVAMLLLATVANAPSYLQRQDKEAPGGGNGQPALAKA